jgi:hypothetical protein
MAYTKQTWADDDATKPLSAARMTVIENGIQAAAATADTANSAATSAQTTANSAVTAANAANATANALATDNVKAAAGSGGLVIVRDGIDVPTGAANEIVLAASTGGTSNVGSGYPPALDIAGGIIGSSLSDPSLAGWPAVGEGESYGNFVTVASGTRQAVRISLYSNRIDRVTWYCLDGSTASLTGQIAIYHPTTGDQLAFTNAVTLTPATIPAAVTTSPTSPGGATQTWNLTTPLTGLSVTSIVLAWQVSGTGTLRMSSAGYAGLTNATAIRPVGSLHRAGQIAGAGTMVQNDTLDMSATAGWTKKAIPNVIIMRTVA